MRTLTKGFQLLFLKALAIFKFFLCVSMLFLNLLRGEEPSHLRVVPPGQRSSDDQCLEIVLAMLRLCVLAWCLVGFRLVFVLISAVLLENGQVLGQNSWGRCSVLALCQVLHLGGGSRGGGFFGTLGATVPLDDSSRMQGGPWAPPPCNEHSPGTL